MRMVFGQFSIQSFSLNLVITSSQMKMFSGVSITVELSREELLKTKGILFDG